MSTQPDEIADTPNRRPKVALAYLPISAAVLAVTATILGLTDVIQDADAIEVLGLAIVLAVLGLRER